MVTKCFHNDSCRDAGFDPAKFRVDPYGNVVYWNADPSSPLGWDIDHWFPHPRKPLQLLCCNSFVLLSVTNTLLLYHKHHTSINDGLELRNFNDGIPGGGKTKLPNLRIVQWQAYLRKRNRLEFLVPWWDLQHGCSINQFLSAFAAKNADFRFVCLHQNMH